MADKIGSGGAFTGPSTRDFNKEKGKDDPMAKTAKSTSAADGGKTKQRAAQKRTFHFFLRALDSGGNPVNGGKVEVVKVLTDPRKVIEYMDSNEYAGQQLTRIKHEMTSEPRDNGDSGELTDAA